MSLWYTNFTHSSGTVKVEATSSTPVSLSLGTPTVQNSLLYTVHSTERVRRQVGIGELNHEGSVLLGGPDCTELVSGRCVKHARLYTDKQHLSISCLLQFNPVQQQTHVTSSSSRFDRKHSVRFLLEGILVE